MRARERGGGWGGERERLPNIIDIEQKEVQPSCAKENLPFLLSTSSPMPWKTVGHIIALKVFWNCLLSGMDMIIEY